MSNKKRKMKKGAILALTAAICVLAVVAIAVTQHLNLGNTARTASSASAVTSSSGAASSKVASSVAVSSEAASSVTALSASSTNMLSAGGLLMLANKDNKLPSGYTPKFTTLPGKFYVVSDKDTRLDERAAPYLQKLITDGRAAGHNLVVYSGYRTYAYQQSNFNRHVKALEAKGETSAQAQAETAKLVAPPGTSEHETGLAADIVSTDYLKKNSDLIATVFDKTSAYTWLNANCAKYGFILRYPENKVSQTKYEYESWHFRFVGVDNAKKIVNSGLCLEEYVAKLNKAK